MKIVLATNNAHKLSEIRAILGNEVEFLCLADIDCHDDIPETSDTLEGNALQKARYVYERYGLNVFADDTGLEIAALDGRPGVHTARYAFPDRNDTEANIDKILGELEGVTDRSARFRTVIALILDGREYLFEGKVDGYITTERLGTDGFGYDPVFSPEETGKTFAELGVEVKNRFSHRARAVRKLCDFLTAHSAEARS
ncbi:MAG: non-canonical purine NTP diphosphatase [Alloprevotella sp.]